MTPRDAVTNGDAGVRAESGQLVTITITTGPDASTTLELDADTYRLVRRTLRDHESQRVRVLGLALPALPGEPPKRRR